MGAKLAVAIAVAVAVAVATATAKSIFPILCKIYPFC
jgi:hypothetical protein